MHKVNKKNERKQFSTYSTASDTEIEYDSDESVAIEEDEEIDTEATTSRLLIRIGTQSDEVADDGKIPCDQCGKRFTKRGMNIHKAVHKK